MSLLLLFPSAATGNVTLDVTAASLSLSGQNVPGVWQESADPVSLSLAPKTVALGEGTTVTAASLSLTGQTIPEALSVAVGGASLTATGQDVPQALTLPVTAAAPTVAGQDVTLTATSGSSYTLTVDSAALSLTPQDVALNTALAVASATPTVAGQDVTLTEASGNSYTLAVDSAALTLAPQGVALNATGQVEQPSGGWAAYNDAQIERNRRRAEKRRRELEEEADRLEMALAAEGLVTPSPEVVNRHTVNEYKAAVAAFNRRTQRAIDYAERARTALAYELAAKEIAKAIEEEEVALTMLIALAA